MSEPVGKDGAVENAEAVENVDAAESAEAEQAAQVAETVADPVLLAARDQARAALAEITDPASIGADAGHEVQEEHVLTLFFECRLPGYPGWRWAAAVARVDEESPVNVLEVELLPGPGSVVAPDWVPWSVRLAQYREAQARQAAEEAADAEAAAAELADEDDSEDDLMENDFSDYDDELDGVDLEGEGGEFADDDADDEDDASDEDEDLDEPDELDLTEDVEGEENDDDTDDEEE